MPYNLKSPVSRFMRFDSNPMEKRKQMLGQLSELMNQSNLRPGEKQSVREKIEEIEATDLPRRINWKTLFDFMFKSDRRYYLSVVHGCRKLGRIENRRPNKSELRIKKKKLRH